MQAVILAAGESSRFWPLNYQQKDLFKMMGKPLICHTIEGLKKAGIKDIIVIQGPQKNIEAEFKNYDLGISIKYIVQPEPKGMGDAIMKAQELVSGPFFVMAGHKVNAGDYIKKMKEKKEEVVLLGSKTNQPWLYGILEIEGDKVRDLIEKPEKGKEPSDIRLSSLYLLPPSFFEYHKKAPEDHYSFEKTLSFYIKEEKAGVFVAEEDSISLKYPWHLFSIAKYLLEKNLGREKVYIGKNVKIFKGAVINGPCYIGDNCVVGNNTLIRGYTNLEEGSMAGALSEVARCIFQKNVHVHSGYFGDSIFGENCRVGAGTVTGNIRLDREEIKETGLNSLGAIVGKETKIGINCSLMPGILIGSHCVVGPGSVVFENIESNKTFCTKFNNETK